MVRLLFVFLPVLVIAGCRPKVIVKTPQEFQQVVKAVGMKGEVKQEYCFEVLAKYNDQFVVWTGCVTEEVACKDGQQMAEKFGSLAKAISITECKLADVSQ